MGQVEWARTLQSSSTSSARRQLIPRGAKAAHEPNSKSPTCRPGLSAQPDERRISSVGDRTRDLDHDEDEDDDEEDDEEDDEVSGEEEDDAHSRAQRAVVSDEVGPQGR